MKIRCWNWLEWLMSQTVADTYFIRGCICSLSQIKSLLFRPSPYSCHLWGIFFTRSDCTVLVTVLCCCVTLNLSVRWFSVLFVQCHNVNLFKRGTASTVFLEVDRRVEMVYLLVFSQTDLRHRKNPWIFIFWIFNYILIKCNLKSCGQSLWDSNVSFRPEYCLDGSFFHFF